jgi:uncharacterized protein YkwD/LysM repeat protein
MLVLMVGCGRAPATELDAPDTAESPSVSFPATSPTVASDALTALPTPSEPVEPEPVLSDLQPAAPAPQAVPIAAPLTVTVGAGDTLLGFALAHGVPMAAIQLQNDLGSSTMIRLGQQLVIPPQAAWEGASPFWIVHVVSQGETLSGIAQTYGLSLTDLQGANGIADADVLGIGQSLVLPVRDFAETRVAAPATAIPATAVPPVVAAATATVEPVAGGTVEAPAAQPTAVPPTAVAVAPAPPPADVAAWGRETVRIINEVRAQHGLPPLIYNETLEQAGQIQANDCAARRSCSHTGSDGSTIKDRVLRVGYQPASWAECWARRLTPQGAVDIWMNETPPNDPHRRTLLTTWLPEIGVGVAQGEWGYYFLAVFGRPLR